ncbi:Alpha/Beta hydrolase protein [Russula earlei]|uniref:Alpha/Beta hydrolase protein n=1 Tax=Russula earlei TaxID=71964 RepID=A0ACC0U3E6_9AGAM|nr:Alpha/Beta hydrolase protein [Russula earlei]
MDLVLSPEDMPAPPPNSQRSPHRSPHPVLRWFGDITNASTASDPPVEFPSSPISPPASPMESLREALTSRLPTPSLSTLKLPPKAVPPPMPLSGSRSFLRNLPRVTLPSASLSIPAPAVRPFNPPVDTQSPGAPIFLQHSPPERSSLDALRSLRDRVGGSSARPTRRHAQASFYSPKAFFSTSATPNWWRIPNDNKENIDALLSDEDRAASVEEERSRIRKKYLSPKCPIVFCHGLLGFDSVTIGPAIAPLEVTHWRGIKEVLQANGVEVLTTRVPATSSPIQRAKVLEQRIEEVYAGRSVHLLGMSLPSDFRDGGLDCRYLTSNLHDHTFRVLSITTISTPHRGSSFADHFLETVGPERFPSFLSLLDMLPIGGGDGSAFSCLTLEAMREFNEQTHDVPGVKYFSWGAVYSPGLIDTWKWPHSVILEKEGPNDGLVSVESAKWGTYLGTLQDVSHLDLVGWINTARYSWARFRGRDIRFRPATFYLSVAHHLAREVDGDPWDASSDRGDDER